MGQRNHVVAHGVGRGRRWWSVAVGMALVLGLVVGLPQPVLAATTTVCPSGCTHTSVQDAVTAAAPGDMISVGAGTYHEVVTVTVDVTITGDGSGSTVLDGDGSGTVVTVPAGVTATISDLTITDGFSATDAGGVRNEGSLDLERVEVTANRANDGGAGIYNLGTLVVEGSTISGNTGMLDGTGSIGGGGIASLGSGASTTVRQSTIRANSLVTPGTDQRGGGGIAAVQSTLVVEDSQVLDNDSGYSSGGIYVAGSSASLALTRSTVSGNRTGTDRGTGRGGGLSLRSSATSMITDSTLSGNHSASAGGGLHVAAPTTVVNTTISGNTADNSGAGVHAEVPITLAGVTITGNDATRYGGGLLANSTALVTADDLLLGGNTAGIDGQDCHGTIDVPAGAAALLHQPSPVCTTTGAGAVVAGQDPLLGPLADNGGPTHTHALLAGSPAIDAGASSLTTDQRGLLRPSGPAPDIGAFEVQAAASGPPFELVPEWGGIGSDIGARALPTATDACGWTPGETVELWWDEPSELLASADVDTDGCFVMATTDTIERIGGARPGPHTISAIGSSSGTSTATYELVSRHVELNPPTGPTGRSVAVVGCGWAGVAEVNVYWTATEALIARSLTVDGAGCFSGSADLPAVRTDGLYAAVAAEGDYPGPGPAAGTSATMYWAQTPTVLLTPPESAPGGRVEVAGCNWFADEPVEFRSVEDDLVFDTIAVAESGCFRSSGPTPLELVVPTSVSYGLHTLRATGADSGLVVDTPFSVVRDLVTASPDEAVPGATVLVTGCGWSTNDHVLLEWDQTDTNNQPIGWTHPIDRATGCLADPGLELEIPPNATTDLHILSATGNRFGSSAALIDVVHPGGSIAVLDPVTHAGDTITVQVDGATVGERIFFSVPRAGTVDIVGAPATAFDVDLTLPLDVPAGEVTLSASSSEGFDADAMLEVLDRATIAVTGSSPPAPGARIEVSGDFWGAGETVHLSLWQADEHLDGLGSVRVADDIQTFTTDVDLPADVPDGTYELRANGPQQNRDATTPITLRSPTVTVSPAGATAGSDVGVTGGPWAGHEIITFHVRHAAGGETVPLSDVVAARSDGYLPTTTTVELPSNLADGSWLLTATGHTGRRGTAGFWIGARTLALTVTQVNLLQTSFDGDVAPGDLYPRIRVDATGFPSRDVVRRDEHTSDVLVADPMWTESFTVSLAAPRILPVEVELYDWDGGDAALDTQADVSPEPGEKTLTLHIDLVDGSWTGGPNGQGCHRGDDTTIAVEVCFATSVLSESGDLDGDGLLDRWEMEGYDPDGDGQPAIDLPDMGASPCRKTIGLDYGALSGRVPLTDSIDTIVASFDNAPVPGPTSCELPGVQSEWGVQLLPTFTNAEPFQDEYACADVYDDREADQSALRQRIFHYAMFVHRRPGTLSTGVACGDGAVIIALGTPDSDPFKRMVKESGTLMHELGHALGLLHGGDENLNYKPNYLSVMNYRFQLKGQYTADGSTFVLDYSRRELPQLNEAHLVESALTTADLETAWTGPDRSSKLKAPANAPIDWNDDGPTPPTSPYRQDLNGDGWCVGPGDDDTLDTTPALLSDDVVLEHVPRGEDRIHSGDDGICDTEVDDTSDDKQIRGVGFDSITRLDGHDDWEAIGYRARNNRRGFGAELDELHAEDDPTVAELDEQFDLWFSPSVSVAQGTVVVPFGEDTATATGTVEDLDDDQVTLSASRGTVELGPEGTWTWRHTVTEEPGEYLVTITADDGDEGASHVTFRLVVDGHEPPTVTAAPTEQTVQTSDHITDIVLTAEGTGASTLAVEQALPAGLVLEDDGCSGVAGDVVCQWTVAGQLTVPAGVHEIAFVASEGGVDSEPVVATLVVEPEDALARASTDNVVAVQVAEPYGDSGAFDLVAVVTESAPDRSSGTPAAGDLGSAIVSVALEPVGPGGAVTPVSSCHREVDGSGYDQVLTVSCPFDAVPVNTYVVAIDVAGRHWTGAGEDVVTVYDPALGSASGGGTFVWPGTAEPERGYRGDRTNVGFAMSYNRRGTNLRGTLVVIRHLEDGSAHRLKSNALDGLALGDDPSGPMSWASFSGKATYQAPGSDPEGNHTFLLYAEDHGEPGAWLDRLRITTRDRDGRVVEDLSVADSQLLVTGNIEVPLARRGGGRGG